MYCRGPPCGCTAPGVPADSRNAYAPPVTGSRCLVVVAGISSEPIGVETLRQGVLGPAHGAVVTFDGMVRDHDTPRY